MKRKMGIVNSSPFTSSYGGVAPFIKNLDPFLKDYYEITYYYLPKYLHEIDIIPRRLTFFLYIIFKIHKLRGENILLSHVPESSFIISYINIPFIHIFHGNHNAMSQSKYWYGKYFNKIFTYFDKRIIKKADIVYTVGEERKNIPKILNPIFHTVKAKINESRNGFIFAGRLEKIKNIDKLIKIYSKLPIDIIEKNKLYIAGIGTQELQLKQIVHELNLVDYVEFLGNKINADLIEVVSNKKVFLMASSQEGLPMAIAEALSVGIPVIATNTGDIRRAIEDNYNGFLLSIDFNDDDYVNKLLIVLNNYNFFSNNAIESSSKFSAKIISNQLHTDINVKIFKNYSVVAELR